MNSKTIIKKYYDGWLHKDREKAFSFLDKDLKFRAPNASYDDADSFFSECWKLSAEITSFDIIHGVYDNEGGYIVYKIGDFSASELIKIRNGKIYEIYVTFNPTL